VLGGLKEGFDNLDETEPDQAESERGDTEQGETEQDERPENDGQPDETVEKSGLGGVLGEGGLPNGWALRDLINTAQGVSDGTLNLFLVAISDVQAMEQLVPGWGERHGSLVEQVESFDEKLDVLREEFPELQDQDEPALSEAEREALADKMQDIQRVVDVLQQVNKQINENEFRAIWNMRSDAGHDAEVAAGQQAEQLAADSEGDLQDAREADAVADNEPYETAMRDGDSVSESDDEYVVVEAADDAEALDASAWNRANEEQNTDEAVEHADDGGFAAVDTYAAQADEAVEPIEGPASDSDAGGDHDGDGDTYDT